MAIDYEGEVLALLKAEPMNGIDLQRKLHLASDQVSESLLYDVLKSLEDAGKIKWHLVSETDGVWRTE